MEIIDVINENGEVIGTKDRKQIYIDGDLHRTVHIWVINSNKEILVQKRSPKKDTYPGLWAISTAGHISSGDNSIETALRELKEELGIKVTERELEFLFSIRRNDTMGDLKINTLDDVYLVQADLDVENTKLQFSELTDIKYVYYEYLEQIFKNRDPEYVPITEEHDKLFNFLHDRFDDHDSIGLLYKTEFEYTYTEHMKLNDILIKHNFVNKLVTFILVILLILDIFFYIYIKDFILLCLFFYIIITYIISFIWVPKYKAKKLFNDYKINKDALMKMNFYEEYFNVKTKQGSAKVYYNQIYKVLETNDNYYIFLSEQNYFAVAKNNIDSSFNSFIRNKVTCPYHKYGQR